MRIGVLGGAFNPPHVGHLVCAQEAHDRLGLDRVTLVPVGDAPHRRIEGDPGGELRALLCERAVSGDERLAVSRAEIERPGPSYTADTLRLLHEQSPDDRLVLILGSDQACSLPDWHAPEEVLRLALVGVAERAGYGRERVRAAVAGLAGSERVGFFEMPRIDVSSSLVRERARLGRPLRYLVPDPVRELIEERSLYRAPMDAAAR